MANNIIVLTRGDTFDFDVSVYEDLYGNYYSNAQEGDILEFKLLRPNQDYFDADENIPLVIRQDIIAGEHTEDCYSDESCSIDHQLNMTFYIEHEDTINLPIGVYYYAVKIYRPATESMKAQYLTVINKTKFVLNG